MPEQRRTKTTGDPETSESEEMYLLTILRAVEQGHEGPLGLASLAERLEVSPASANEMIRKMADRGLVAYEPYKGASLTDAGSGVAKRVVRARRLWARFLADHLGFTPREADAMACELEHVASADAIDRLDDFLGHPESGPLGRPIPEAVAHPGVSPAETLSSIPAGAAAEVIAVTAGRETVRFLAVSGVGPGDTVTVIATGAQGVLLGTARGELHLDTGAAASVLVRPKDSSHGA